MSGLGLVLTVKSAAGSELRDPSVSVPGPAERSDPAMGSQPPESGFPAEAVSGKQRESGTAAVSETQTVLVRPPEPEISPAWAQVFSRPVRAWLRRSPQPVQRAAPEEEPAVSHRAETAEQQKRRPP